MLYEVITNAFSQCSDPDAGSGFAVCGPSCELHVTDATTRNNFVQHTLYEVIREWDYTTYTNVYEHTGELDSVQYNHKKYTLNNNGFSVFNGTFTPKYHKYAGQYTQNTYNFTGQNDYTAGTAQTTTNFGITAGAPDSKTYLLYSAPDLT